MKKSFEVDEIKKIVIVNMKKITDKQLDMVNKYQKIGFTVKTYVPEKKNEYTRNSILEALKDKPELIKAYNDVCNEPVIDKETGKPKLLKNGNVKTKGHIAGVKWYKEYLKSEELKK